VAKLPATESQSPLDDIPDHEVAELKRLAARASARDIMRLFRLMADSQEQIIKSPYPDLLLEMAVVRMASLAAVIDADELIRAIGAGGNAPPAAGKPPMGKPPGESGGARGSSASSKEASSKESSEPSAGATRLRVEGEVKADAPLRVSAGDDAVAELPELRNFIRGRRAALAGFMEQGAGLVLDGSILTVTPRNDIYIRYLSDNRAVIAELASEHLGRPIRVELSNAGGGAARSKSANPVVAENAATREVTTREVPAPQRQVSKPSELVREATLAPAAGSRRVATPEERTAVLSDPAMRRVFDTLDARLVELRMPNNAGADAAKENGDTNLNEGDAAETPAARER